MAVSPDDVTRAMRDFLSPESSSDQRAKAKLVLNLAHRNFQWEVADSYLATPEAMTFLFRLFIRRLESDDGTDEADSEHFLKYCQPDFVVQLYQKVTDDRVLEWHARFMCACALELHDYWTSMESDLQCFPPEAVVVFLALFCKEIARPRLMYVYGCREIHDMLRARGYAVIMDLIAANMRDRRYGSLEALTWATEWGELSWLDNSDMIGWYREFWNSGPEMVKDCLRLARAVVDKVPADRRIEVIESMGFLQVIRDIVGSDDVELMIKAAKLVDCIGRAVLETPVAPQVIAISFNLLDCQDMRVARKVLGFIGQYGIQAIRTDRVADAQFILVRVLGRMKAALEIDPSLLPEDTFIELCHVFAALCRRSEQVVKQFLAEAWGACGSEETVIFALLFITVELMFQIDSNFQILSSSELSSRFVAVCQSPMTKANWSVHYNWYRFLVLASSSAFPDPISQQVKDFNWTDTFCECMSAVQSFSDSPVIQKSFVKCCFLFPVLKPGKIRVDAPLLCQLLQTQRLIPLAASIFDKLLAKTKTALLCEVQSAVRTAAQHEAYLSFLSRLADPLPAEMIQVLERFLSDVYEENRKNWRSSTILALVIESTFCLLHQGWEIFVNSLSDLGEPWVTENVFFSVSKAARLFQNYVMEHKSCVAGSPMGEISAWVPAVVQDVLDGLDDSWRRPFVEDDNHVAVTYFYKFAALALRDVPRDSYEKLYQRARLLVERFSRYPSVYQEFLSFAIQVVRYGDNVGVERLVSVHLFGFLLSPGCDLMLSVYAEIIHRLTVCLRTGLRGPCAGMVRSNIGRALADLGAPEDITAQFITLMDSPDGDIGTIEAEATVLLDQVRQRICMNLMEWALLDRVIHGAVSPGNQREECEQQFCALVSESPLSVLQFLLSRVAAPGDSKLYTTMAHWCLGEKTTYQALSGEDFGTVVGLVLDLTKSPKLASDEGKLIGNLVLRFVNISRSLNMWPGAINVFCQMVESENEMSAILAMDILAEVISTDLEIDEPVLRFCYEMAKGLLGGTYRHAIVVAVKMVMVLSGRLDVKECCENVLTMLSACNSDDDLKVLTYEVTRFTKDFFVGMFPRMMEVMWAIVCDRSKPTLARVRLLEFICDMAVSSYDHIKDFIPHLIPSLVELLTDYQGEDGNIEYVCDFANYFISLISRKSGDCEIDRLFMEKIGEYMRNECVGYRFAAFSCLNEIMANLCVNDMQKTAEPIFAAISDPEPVCRNMGYKCIIALASECGFREEMNESLHERLFPALFEVLSRERVGEVIQTALKAVAACSRACGSEVLVRYAPAVMGLCVAVWRSGSEDLMVGVMQCVVALSKSLREHIEPFFDPIAEIGTEMLKSDSPPVRFTAITSVPKICVSVNSDKAKILACLCVQAFGAIFSRIPEFYGDKEQTSLFKSVLALVHAGLVGITDVPVQEIIGTLMRIASGQLTLAYQHEDCDGFREPNTIYVRYQTGYLTVSKDEIQTVANAFSSLAELFLEFPELCVPHLAACVEMIKLHLNLPLKMLTLSVYSLIKTLLSRHDVLQIPVDQVLDLIPTNYSVPWMSILTSQLVIKAIFTGSLSPLVFEKANNISLFLLKESRERRNEMHGVDVDDELIRKFDKENRVERWIATTFAALYKRYRESLSQDFIESTSNLFALDLVDSSKTAIMTFWTQRIVVDLCLIPDVVTFCIRYVMSVDPVERRIACHCLGKIVKHIDLEPSVLSTILQSLLPPLSDGDSDFESAQEEALLAYTRALDKYEFARQPEVITTWLQYLPFPDADHGIYVHRFFATALRSNTSLFMSPPNANHTLRVIAKTCMSRRADSESKAVFKEVLISCLSDGETQALMTEAIKNLGPVLEQRLGNFLAAA